MIENMERSSKEIPLHSVGISDIDRNPKETSEIDDCG
jgi:hypothetical protein